jgi:hypothetical protein
MKHRTPTAEDAADKIMLAFDWGGLVPLDLHQYAVIDAHVRSVLSRAMETEQEKKARKRRNWLRVKNERRRA